MEATQHMESNGLTTRKCKRNNSMKLRLGTWNVRTMLQPGKMYEITDELKRYRMDVVALQEMRLQGIGDFKEKEYDIYYCGTAQKTGLYGTGFYVSSRIRGNILGREPINERIYKIRIKGKFQNITIISCHAPTEVTDEIYIEGFYEALEKTCKNVSPNDMLLITGDFNAKIGREDVIRKVAGYYSLHDVTSDNGFRMCDFAAANKLWIKSVSFPHKNIHKGTWKKPGSDIVNQIDHVLVDNRHATSISNVQTCRGASCDSDHYLVIAVVKQRIANIYKKRGETRKKWNVEKLVEDDNVQKLYKENCEEMNERLLDINENSNIEDIWHQFKTVVNNAAEKAVGVIKKKRNDEWYDNECRKAIAIRNEVREKLLNNATTELRVEYNEKRKIAKKLCRAKKRVASKLKIQDLEKNYKENRKRDFYKNIASERNGYQPRTNMCKDKENQIITEEEKIMCRWKQYFEELLNCEQIINQECEEVYSADPYIPDPSYTEVVTAIRKLKNNKAPGSDLMCAELIKYGNEPMYNALHKIICKVWQSETMPKEWNIGVICPVYKKGDKLECSNYRGISLLCSAYKVLTNILHRRVEQIAEEALGEYQCGFRKGRGTTDQLFVVTQAAEKCIEYNIDMHCIFIDFKQAFDSVNRNTIKNALILQGIPKKITQLILMTLENTTAKVALQNKQSETFKITTGVRQGDALSAVIFNLIINQALSKIDEISHNNTILTKSVQLCGYADDLILIARSRNNMVEVFERIEIEVSKMGIKINQNKTKYMIISTTKATPSSIRIGDKEYKGVDSYKYLGAVFTTKYDTLTTIQDRIQAGNRSYFSMRKMIQSKILSRKTKLAIYKTVIRPVVTYGCEVWRLTESEANKIAVFERKILRKIFGPVILPDETFRIRYNDELDNLIEGDTILRYVKRQRLSWLGHMVRMPKDRVQSKIYEGEIHGNRRRGRPRKRWKEGVEEDLDNMNVINWKLKAKDRQIWKDVVMQA